MVVTVLGISTFSKFSHPAKACSHIVVTPSGIVISFRPDSEKAHSPMVLTVFGISMEVRFLHAWKERSPISVTSPSNTTVDSSAQSLQREKLVFFTFGPITTFFKGPNFESNPPPSLGKLTSCSLSKITSSRASQPSKGDDQLQ